MNTVDWVQAIPYAIDCLFIGTYYKVDMPAWCMFLMYIMQC